MSEFAGPTPKPSDEDAWSKACEEDLAAEQARRRAAAGGGFDGVEELRKLMDDVVGRLGGLGGLVGGGAVAGLAAEDVASRVRSAVDPVLERHSDVIGHLSRAGDELVAACRAAFTPQQQDRPEPADGSSFKAPRDARDAGEPGDDGEERDNEG